MGKEGAVEKYWRRVAEVRAVVEAYLQHQREAGVTQLLIKDVRQQLLMMNGRPTGMADSILQDLKREEKIRDVMIGGNDGIVYL